MTKEEALNLLRSVLADAGTAYRCPTCGSVWVMSGRSCDCDSEGVWVDYHAILKALAS